LSARLRYVPNGPREERLFDLLYTRAMQPLTDAEQSELDALIAESPDIDTDCYDRAAAAIDLHCRGGRVEALPNHLRERILAVAPARPKANVTRTAPNRERPASSSSSARLVMWSGWVVAAAASILAFVAWSSRPAPVRVLTASEQRMQLVGQARDAITIPFKSTDDPHGKSVSGDLVWSPSQQRGFMRFHGLPVNDPKASQYQLWIFDKPRGTDHPVDGGVFDVQVASGEAVVPIDAKIRVFEPAMFAVTEELPGGVVVSKREHIVALATF
jgi:hypothetical protein